MLKQLGREIEVTGDTLQVHTQPDGHILMVVEFSDTGAGEITGVGVRVRSVAGLETGARLLMHQLDIQSMWDLSEPSVYCSESFDPEGCPACGSAIVSTAATAEQERQPKGSAGGSIARRLMMLGRPKRRKHP